ncbi:metal ABC transporter solute-binding protein, Zn/Mn family [Porphyromonas macacae]|uniref:metal ABC transporter solute-binding protein, Zn/Mn family n=1 Tax=Porphyromonas macacae TaxID=28115 RepID=UPI0024ACC48B|nr:zinc ABC transporter substrate-binding protein [Porphyromonas macacae]
MNKILRSLFCILIISVVGTSCEHKTKRNIDKLTIAVSITPQQELLQILADTLVNIWTIVPEGKNPEIYDPTPQEMRKLSDCNAYFYVGDLGFETAWSERIGKLNNRIRIFRLTPPHHHHEGEHHRHDECDPHVWTSPDGIYLLAENMLSALCTIDPENEPVYEQGMQRLSESINNVRNKVNETLKEVTNKAFVIYHPSLTGFAREFGFKQLTIEQNGKEPTPEDLKRIVDEAKSLNVKVVFIQKEFNTELAMSVAKEIGAEIVKIEPLSANWQEQILSISKALAQHK